MNYGLTEIIGATVGLTTMAGIVIGLYNNKIKTERAIELENIRNEFERRNDKIHEMLMLQTQALEHDKHRTEEEMNRLTMNMSELTKSVTTLTESVSKLAVEVGVTKESVKSAHKRISEVQRYE